MKFNNVIQQENNEDTDRFLLIIIVNVGIWQLIPSLRV